MMTSRGVRVVPAQRRQPAQWRWEAAVRRKPAMLLRPTRSMSLISWSVVVWLSECECVCVRECLSPPVNASVQGVWWCLIYGNERSKAQYDLCGKAGSFQDVRLFSLSSGCSCRCRRCCRCCCCRCRWCCCFVTHQRCAPLRGTTNACLDTKILALGFDGFWLMSAFRKHSETKHEGSHPLDISRSWLVCRGPCSTGS